MYVFFAAIWKLEYVEETVAFTETHVLDKTHACWLIY